MQKVRGLIFASALLCAGSAHAFEMNRNTPTIHQLNPPPPPPSPQTGSGTGKVNLGSNAGSSHQGSGSGPGKLTPALTVRKAGGKPLLSDSQ